MNELPKACVILGAGASHDVHGEGSVIINGEYIPPLAIDLFNIEKNNTYSRVLQYYPGARFLTQQLASLIKSGQVSIEDELKRYSIHKDQQIREHFKHIPGYLRDLIFLSSTQYTQTPTSYSQLVHGLIAENPHEVLFLVLNYDNLLETALNLYSPEYKYTDISQYVSENRKAKVVKLHGSINWFKNLTSDGNMSWNEIVKLVDVTNKVHETTWVIKDGISNVSQERINRYWAYPIITAPLASKDISNAVCPESHINVVKNFLKDCQKYLIIGTSGLDGDLLDILNSTLTEPPKNHYVHVVGSSAGAEDCSYRFKKRVNAFSNGIPNENIFRDGFRVYLKSAGFHSFAEYQI